MTDVGAKLFKYESPSRDSLRCTNCYLVDQLFMVGEYVYFLSKQDPSELFETFGDWEKFLLCSHVIQLYFWIIQLKNAIGLFFWLMTAPRC